MVEFWYLSCRAVSNDQEPLRSMRSVGLRGNNVDLVLDGHGPKIPTRNSRHDLTATLTACFVGREHKIAGIRHTA